jgi:vacuolar-type H+-ATPase subunit I/STV1
MTITTLKRSTKFIQEVEGKKVEPEVKEKVLSEYRTTNDIATAMYGMLSSEYNDISFNKDGDIEFERYISSDLKVAESIIIFLKINKMTTNQDIINLSSGLESVRNLSGIKFAYVVSKNANKVKSEMEAFKDMTSQSKDFQEYEKERIELVELHAKKDEKGKSIIVGNEYEIDNQQAFDAQIKVLQEKHKEAIDARKKQVDDFNSFLKEESKLELHKIDINDCPKEITTGQMSGIFPIITGEIKE